MGSEIPPKWQEGDQNSFMGINLIGVIEYKIIRKGAALL